MQSKRMCLVTVCKKRTLKSKKRFSKRYEGKLHKHNRDTKSVWIRSGTTHYKWNSHRLSRCDFLSNVLICASVCFARLGQQRYARNMRGGVHTGKSVQMRNLCKKLPHRIFDFAQCPISYKIFRWTY